ncbi:MAG: S1 family peptidase [Myxococcales bacterium]|nr:S1 family peptidase [Myxococcales bacterium]
MVHLPSMTLEYIGQARFSHTPRAIGTTFYVHGEPPTPDPPSDVPHDMIKQDAEGRLWRAIWVDPDVPAPPHEVDEPVDPRSRGAQDLGEPDREPEDGEVGFVTRLSWDRDDCDSDGDEDNTIWEPEDRTSQSWTTERQKTIVRLSGATGCTGTIIRDDWILTSAHCWYDDNGDWIPTSGVTVEASPSLHPSVQTQTPSMALVPTAYSPTAAAGDVDDDWALVKVPTGYNGPDMNLSTADNSTINLVDPNVKNLGFPAWIGNGCTPTTQLYHQDNVNITGKFSERLRWKGDFSVGSSGGPLFYCPAGQADECLDGQKGWILAVVSGFNSNLDRLVGPRVKAFKDTATTWIEDN